MKKNNVLSVEEQISSEVNFAIELKYQIMIKETELKIMEQTKQTSAIIKSSQMALENLKEQYDLLFQSGSELFLNLNNAPEVSVFIKKMEREIDYYNEVLKFVGPLYEQARISEAKYTPSFEVLDYAHRPDRKAKPKRAVIVVAAFMFALLSSGVYVLLKETQD